MWAVFFCLADKWVQVSDTFRSSYEAHQVAIDWRAKHKQPYNVTEAYLQVREIKTT